MNSDDELRKIVVHLAEALTPLRSPMGRVWQPLNLALSNSLKVLGMYIEPEGSAIHEGASWETSITELDVSLARDVSLALIDFSESLTRYYRAVTPRDARVSHVLAQVYLDVQRPLWQAHPDLAPPELRK